VVGGATGRVLRPLCRGELRTYCHWDEYPAICVDNSVRLQRPPISPKPQCIWFSAELGWDGPNPNRDCLLLSEFSRYQKILRVRDSVQEAFSRQKQIASQHYLHLPRICCATRVSAFISANTPKLRNTNRWDVLDGYGRHPGRETLDTKRNTEDNLLKLLPRSMRRSGERYSMLEALLDNDSGIESDIVAFHSKIVSPFGQ